MKPIQIILVFFLCFGVATNGFTKEEISEPTEEEINKLEKSVGVGIPSHSSETNVGKLYTFDIDITDKDYGLVDEDYVLIYEIPYDNIRTTGAIVQLYYSPGVVGSAQWFAYDTHGIILMPGSLHLPIGKWFEEGLRPGYKIRVVVLTGE